MRIRRGRTGHFFLTWIWHSRPRQATALLPGFLSACICGSIPEWTAVTEREFAIDVVRRLRGAGFTALWAGGCVRDELLGLAPKDYDVATDARPEQVRQLFPRTVAVGESFGVVEVLSRPHGGVRHRVQVATFRSDVS